MAQKSSNAKQQKRTMAAAIRVLGVEFPGQLSPKRSRVGEERRTRILDAAVTLFRELGFHGASIDGIGEAAGVSGPALYYYFKDKSEVLLAVYLRVGDSMIRTLINRIEGLTDTAEVFNELIDNHIEAMWENRETFPLLYQENRNLSPVDREESNVRRKFWYELWGHSLHELRPELSISECETMVQGALWLIQSVAFYDTTTEPEELKATLRRMAHAALFETPAH
jgi:AcrR family transcriptional regulator